MVRKIRERQVSPALGADSMKPGIQSCAHLKDKKAEYLIKRLYTAERRRTCVPVLRHDIATKNRNPRALK